MKPLLARLAALAAVTAIALAACGATRVNVAPVKIEPIHVTIDVHLHDGSQPPPSQPAR